MRAFDYAIAENVSGALAALGKGYRIKASGIDLLDMLKERTEKHDRFVAISSIDELKGIEERDGGIYIGALATLKDMAESPILRRAYPALAHSAGEAATAQIRARATAAGNILQRPRCWYFRSADYPCLKKGGSTCYAWDGENAFHSIFKGGPCRITHPSNIAPPLVAADAQIIVTNGDEEKRYAAREFFVNTDQNLARENNLADDEIVTGMHIPKSPQKSAYIEFKEKQSFDWPMASCVAAWHGDRWSVVLGHVAPLPWRCTKAEELLGDTADIDNALAQRAAEAAVADADPMSQNAFRVRIARAAVRRTLLLACGKEID